MSKVMVTGAGGFVGPHLVNELLRNDCQVIGVGMTAAKPEGLAGDYIQCELTDPEQVAKLPLADVDAIINLAGLANVGESYQKADLYRQVNVKILETLADSILAQGLTSLRLIAVSTGGVYDTSQKPPFTEETALAPTERLNPYVQSKILTEEAAQRYRDKGLSCVVARPFNHIGPGQLPGFILPDLALQLQQASAAKQTQIMVGDLTKERDYTDVRDVVRAYRLMATATPDQLTQPIYNICSGQSHSGKELLELLIKTMGLGDIQVKVDPERLRPNDPQDLFGSAARLKQAIGWQPEISLEQTIKDFVDWSAN